MILLLANALLPVFAGLALAFTNVTAVGLPLLAAYGAPGSVACASAIAIGR